MLGCAVNADEVSMPGPPARVGAEQLVFESDALLLSILQFHKTCLGWKSNKPSASRWKKSFASLLRVCDAFHRVGASVLWEEMDSMIPVLKLLPWYGDSERRYSGMGTHKYERELDWLRFQLYTSKIRRMRIARQCDVELPPHWTLELITLQGRPNPLFPSLQSITFGRGTHPSISCIVLLVNPSLQSVDITIQPLADTNGPVGVTASQPAETNLLAVLPAMSFSTPRLRKFDYQGPLNEKITHGLSNLRNLTSLHLEITNAASPVDLQGLQGFPQLKDLQVIAPNLQCTSPESVLLVKMGNLRKLEVATSDVCHFHLARLLCRAPRLNNLTLIVTSNVKTVAVCSALALYIGNCKQELQSLRVSFMSSQPAKEVTDALDNKNLPFWAEIEKELLSGLKGATSLQGMTFRDVPRTFAVAFIPILTSTVQYWRNLTTLAFHIQADNYGSPISYYGPYMCAMSFLRTVIWKFCPKLRSLELPFSVESVITETISSALDTLDDEMDAMGVVNDQYHPLQSIILNTGSSPLKLTTKRKVEIATFLDGLFPHLSDLRETPSDPWGEIANIVEAYQDQRVRFSRRVERMATAFFQRETRESSAA